jgi:hypothetical protein
MQVLAEALLGFIDVDRNGRIEGGELKVGASIEVAFILRATSGKLV